MTTTTMAPSLWLDVPRRLATICIGVPILWAIWLNNTLRHLFFQGTHLVICWEWVQLTASAEGGKRWIFIVLSILLSNVPDNNLFILSLVLISAVLVVMGKDAHTLGFLFITIPLRAWCYSVSSSFEATVSLLLTVWNCDTGALLAGRLSKSVLSKPMPSPEWLRRISPSKSVVGLVGGITLGILTYWFLPTFWNWIYLFDLASRPDEGDKCEYFEAFTRDGILRGAAISLSAILGDLVESSLKRRFKVKDSGKLLPGHGGVLDRFDSSLLAVLLFPFTISNRKCI